MFITEQQATDYLIATGTSNPTDQQIADMQAELESNYKFNLLRAERDALLAKCDWMVMPDRTATQEQLDYRQALRDLPSNVTADQIEINEKGELINYPMVENPMFPVPEVIA